MQSGTSGGGKIGYVMVDTFSSHCKRDILLRNFVTFYPQDDLCTVHYNGNFETTKITLKPLHNSNHIN